MNSYIDYIFTKSQIAGNTYEISVTSIFNKTRLLYLFNFKSLLESKLYALELKLGER